MKCYKMASSSTAFFVVSLLVLGCAYATDDEPENFGYSDLSYGISDFSGKLLNEVSKLNKNKSVIQSGISVLYVLYMAYLGAKGRTACEIIKAIGVKKNEAFDQFTALTDALIELEGVTFNMANKIYVKSGEQYTLDTNYKQNVIDSVDGKVESINFNQNKQAAQTMNSWVEKQTNNKIKDLIQPGDLDASTRVVLINAIYFKGTWQKTFDEKATRSRPFYVTKQKTVQLPTMTMKAKLPYAEDADLGCKILKLDYAGGNASMVILLPNDIDGINALNDKIGKDDNAIYNALDKVWDVYVDVDVRLPKFKTETQIDLKYILPKLGIKQIFDPAKSRLDYMLENPQQLYVSKMIQKAVIEVNEDGAEAAAATAAVIHKVTASVGRPIPVRTFYADHPYQYLILTSDEVVLFSGLFNGIK